MKNLSTLLITLSLILCIAFLIADNILYDYGKNDLPIRYKKLPKNLKPENYGYDRGNLGFVFEDENGFTSLSKGNSYKINGVTLKINDFIRYKYNENKLIVNIKDENQINKYLLIENTPNFKIATSDLNEFNELSEKEINIKHFKEIRKIELIRNYSLTLTILLLSAFSYLFLKRPPDGPSMRSR